jgi:multidrug efflux system outer membrane protein
MSHKRITLLFLAIILTGFAILSGCKVGPNYKRPAMKIDSLYRFARSSDTASLADLAWVSLFKDTVLQGLVDTGLKNNFDVRIAFARIEQARASFKEARGNQWPQFGIGADGGWQQTPTAGGNVVQINNLSAYASVSWEIDLWGKMRRSKEAARANLFAQMAYQQSVRLTLIYEIVSSYFDLLELDNEYTITRQNIRIREQSLALVRAKMIAGTASGLVVAQAEAELALAMTEIPKLEMLIAQKENYISTLLGDAPHAIKRGRPMLDQLNIPAISTPGIPSQLIVRRPDIIMAEQTLVAANANIGVARAMMLPSLSISGSIGGSFFPTNLIYNALGNLIAPIFGGGKLRAGYKKAVAQKSEMLYTYQQTIQNSFKEVSDAIISVTKQRDIVVSQQATVNAAQTAFDLSNQLYNAGYASYLDVINAQAMLFSSQINLSVAQSNELTALVTLYTALGGGWK